MAKIEGLRKLTAQLNKLEATLATKTLRNATRAAMVPTHKKIQALTPKMIFSRNIPAGGTEHIKKLLIKTDSWET